MPARKVFIGLVAAATTLMSTPHATIATTRNDLAGTWKLISYAERPAGAPTEYPYGAKPVGLLIYESSGHNGDSDHEDASPEGRIG